MAVLKSGTTIGGSTAIHASNMADHGIITTSNIGSYALTGVPSNVITTSGGQTIAGTTYFSGGESLNLYGIRGRFTNEYIHLYHKVGIGHPSGWGQGEGNTPGYGLSTYGGMNIAYGNGASSTINGYLRINQNWAGGDYSAEALTIRGTYPSITLRSTGNNSKWLIHHANGNPLQFYFGGTVDDNNWANKFEIASNGNIWMEWGGWLSDLLNAKQNASTAITTSNIGSQSVASASQVSGVSVSATEMNRLKTTLGATGLPYSCDIFVEGDPNTYYPVHFIWGDQDVWRRIIIKRGYSEEAPWDPIGTGVHHGGLLLDWEGNFGGWGGAEYSDRLRVFNESYTNVCADMYIYTHAMGYVFMLRGGGALYHIFSDQEIRGYHQVGTPDIAYDTSKLFYDHSIEAYKVYAPAPVTTVNSSRIDGLRTKKQSLLDGRYARKDEWTGSSYIGSDGVFWGTRFYDSNDGSYYLDPASTSVLYTANITNTYVGNAIYFGGANNYLNWDGARINSNVGIQSAVDMRAPIFYDSQDTSYYLDPNSTSNLAASYIGRVLINYDGTDTWFRMQSGNRMRITTTGGTDFIIPNTGEMSYNGNTVIHTGNIGSQSVAYADRARGFGGYPHAGYGMMAFYNWGGSNGGTSAPHDGSYTVGISVGSNPGDQAYGFQIGRNMWNDGLWTRGYDSGWREWVRLIDSTNIGSQSVSYASSAGNADTVDGWHRDDLRAWGNLTGVPSTFTPSSHTHDDRYYTEGESDGRFTRNLGTQVNVGSLNDLNGHFTVNLDGYGPISSGGGPDDSYNASLWNIGNSSRGHQLYMPYDRNQVYWRRGAGGWSEWYRLLNASADPIPANMNQYVRTSDSVTFANVYTAGWFRNYGQQGIYNQDYGNHFYSVGSGAWGITGAGGTVELQFRSNHQSTLRGYVYADTSNNIGFLSEDGNWVLRTWNRGVEAYGSMRAPIFYDSADTGYYGDFASTSRLSRLLVQQAGVNSTAGPALRVSKGWDNGTPDIVYDTVVIESNDVTTIRMKEADGGTAGWSTGDGNTSFTSNVPMRFYTGGNESSYIYSGQGGTLAMYIGNDQKIGIGTSDFSYAANDNSRTVGSTTNNKLFVNGSIQLLSNNDAIVIGRGTATFLSDEELGFGWGGGWYMTDGDYLRVRNNKILYSTGEVRSGGYRGTTNVGGTGEASWHPAGIYVGSTQWLYGTQYRNGSTTSGQGWMYLDYNYGHSIVGLYDSRRYQGVWAMGDAYKLPVDGTTTGSLYGLAWSHPNAGGVAGNLSSHGLLVMENGTFLAAISGSIRARDDMRAPIFYDSQDTGYYLDPNGASYLNRLTLAGSTHFYPNNWIEFPGNYGLYSGTNNAHFYPNDASYGSWRIIGTRNGWNGINFDANNGYVALMINPSSNTIGFHNQAYGWQFYWESGTLYCHKNAYGGGTGATVLDSSNVNSYAVGLSGDQHIYNAKWFHSDLGNTLGNLSGPSLQAVSYSGYSAFMSFHRWGYYAVNMGLDNDNVFRIGGWSAAANRMQLDMSGNVTFAGDVTAFSDARIKENVKTIEGALDKTLKLRGVSYNRIDSDDKSTKIGVIAQEILEIVPEVVSQDSDGMYNVSYGNITALLIEAIKEQQKQIEELKSIINGLTT